MDNEIEKRFFYSKNLNLIKTDIARAQGDYLKTFLAMNECDQKEVNWLYSVLRDKYEEIFSCEDESKSYNLLQSILRNWCQA